MRFFLFIGSIFQFSILAAQGLLTPEQAVSIALKHNYDIVLAKNDVEIAKLNNHAGAAGQLPKVTVNLGENYMLNNIYQELASGTITNKDNVSVNNLNAGITANWTVFDGMKMFATKQRLNALQSQSEFILKDQLQNTVAQTLTLYYQVVQQKLQLNALNELIKLYEERVFLSQKKFEVGYADKSAYLQAKVEIASQKINILKQKTLIQQSKAALNQVMGKNASLDFDVIDTFHLQAMPSLSVLMDSSYMSYSVKLAQKNIEINQLQAREINAGRMPTVSLNSGYNFSQNNSKAGLLLVNRSTGPQIGISASIPIYNGGVVKKQLDANRIQMSSSQVALDQLKNEVNMRLFNAYQNYELAKSALLLYEENTKVARENLQLAYEKFKHNQTTSLDLKTAQNAMEQSLNDVITSKYNAQIAEIELKRLANILVKSE